MTPTELYEYLTSVDTKGPVLEYVSKESGRRYILNKIGVRSYKWNHRFSVFLLDRVTCKLLVERGKVVPIHNCFALDENEIWE